MSLYVSLSKFPQHHCRLPLRLPFRLPFMCLAFAISSPFPHLSLSPATPPPPPLVHNGRSSSLCPQAQGESSTTVYLKTIDTHTVPKHHACEHTAKWHNTQRQSQNNNTSHSEKTAERYMHTTFSWHMLGAKSKTNKHLHSVTLPPTCTQTHTPVHALRHICTRRWRPPRQTSSSPRRHPWWGEPTWVSTGRLGEER